MVECQDRSVVLMSIHPRWADAIMDGRKQVEFRRADFSRPISRFDAGKPNPPTSSAEMFAWIRRCFR
jgi:hypothetical protein